MNDGLNAVNALDSDVPSLEASCLCRGRLAGYDTRSGGHDILPPRLLQHSFFGIHFQLISYLTELHENAYKLASSW